MVESLQDGVHGLTLSIPAGFELMTNEAMVATLVDKQLGVSWHFFFFPDVTLDLSSEAEASLRRGVAHHADHLLQTMSRAERAEMGIPGEVPELSRPALVSCETVSVDGAPALMVLHRMVRRPGREIVMGHLLVPVAEGLFEARWLALTEMTGLRESVLLAKALGTSDPTMEPARAGEAGAMKLGLIQVEEDGRSIDEVEAIMNSLDYDDPKHDADFPGHVLSVARRAGKWIREEAGLRVTERSPGVERGETIVEQLGFALVLPPRFTPHLIVGTEATFRRVSLAGNDGVQFLIVKRMHRPGNVMKRVEKWARDGLLKLQMISLSVSSRAATTPLLGIAVADGAQATERARVVTAGVGDGQELCMIALVTTPAQPAAVIEAELVAVANSYRALKPLPRPWWKVW